MKHSQFDRTLQYSMIWSGYVLFQADFRRCDARRLEAVELSVVAEGAAVVQAPTPAHPEIPRATLSTPPHPRPGCTN